MPRVRSYTIVALLVTAAGNAQASCGAAFCTLNTAWEAQGVPSDPGLRLDMRFEYIDQDQPRAGRREVAVGEIAQHHDEQRTLNRNLIATLDYAPGADWGLSLQLPYLQREHAHIHNHGGAALPQAWDFDGLGDARLTARRRLGADGVTHGVIGGIKLPTGDKDVRNSDGDLAERSLQPGSGTTDLVLGYYANTMRALGTVPVRFFLHTQAQAPVNESDGYRPGAQYSVDLGMAYPAAGTWSALLQVNALVRRRDRGEEAEPENTGGSFVHLSPGVGYTAGGVQFYGFVQLPVYQRVNGVQLTADSALAVGFSVRF